MTYKLFNLVQYGLEIEVAVIPQDDTTSFLSSFEVGGGKISKKDYEDYLVKSLIRDPVMLQTFMDNLETSHERSQLHYSVLAAVFSSSGKTSTINRLPLGCNF